MRQPIPLPGPEIYDGIEERGLATDIFTGWHSLHPFFESIIKLTKPKVIIEVGSWKGGSAINMARLAPEAKIYCVDHWLGGADHVTASCAFRQGVQRDKHGWPGIYYQFLHNVAVSGLRDRIVPIPMMTKDGATLLRMHNIQADLIYIDADHDEGPVCEDSTNYMPLLKEGGFMFGDDYFCESVKRGVMKAFSLSEPPAPAEPTGTFWATKKE